MKKQFITSAIAILASLPAFATPSHTSSTFPQDGYMLEDYTYTNAATSTNMDGVYEGSVNADEYFSVDAGYYLPANTTTPAQCPAGSFCPGISSDITGASASARGITACSTLDGSYTSSAAGSTADTDCYKACTVANANIAHATAVSGNDYYGTGTDTCSATSCENGYHTQSFDVESAIGTVSSSAIGYINPGGGASNASTFGLTENGTFALEYSNNKGTIKGRAQCSTQSGTSGGTDASAYTTSATLPDSTGQYCYCTVDEYTPVGGSSMSLSGPWVFYFADGSASNCANSCAAYCANRLGYTGSNNFVFRSAVLGSLTGGAATCEANVISITWSGASASDIAANDAGTCTYGGEIRTPVAAAVIPGKTFVGWKFVRTPQEENSEL